MGLHNRTASALTSLDTAPSALAMMRRSSALEQRKPAMYATTTCTIASDIKVVVLDSLEQITTYVLKEQHDWFEDEIRFVRMLLNPGDSVIDLGANLGVYALSMARVVGKRGRVTAFEPASETAALLRASALLNGFTQLEVEQKGLAA